MTLFYFKAKTIKEYLLAYLERRVVGSFITITSAISPNFEKCSFRPSVNNIKTNIKWKNNVNVIKYYKMK
jgi:hypothetical protein